MRTSIFGVRTWQNVFKGFRVKTPPLGSWGQGFRAWEASFKGIGFRIKVSSVSFGWPFLGGDSGLRRVIP